MAEKKCPNCGARMERKRVRKGGQRRILLECPKCGQWRMGQIEAREKGVALRLLIAGVPRSGKTTLAGEGAIHTDDYIGLGWSEASLAVSCLFDEPGPWVIEGVAIPRALRKWLVQHPTGKPCDKVIFLNEPFGKLSSGQQNMAKGCRTVWLQVVGELRQRGVVVKEI